MTSALQRSPNKHSANGTSSSTDELLYKSSSLALVKHKHGLKTEEVSISSNHDRVDSTMRYLEASQKVLDFLRRMWLDQKSCDMVITLQNGEMLAHRVVFAAHSQILAEKFAHFGPDQIVTIQLSDFAVKPVFELTQFLYTTDLCLTVDNVAEIYKCAAELGLNSVFEYAREFLSNYNVSNAILFYNICDQGNITDLRDEIFSFICEHFHEIIQHESFKRVALEDLMNLLKNNHLGVHSELDVFFAVCRWLEGDLRRRMPLSNKLLGCVRFQHIKPEDICTKVCSVEWLMETKENIAIINQAYKFHSLKATGSPLVSRFPVQVHRSRAPGMRRKSSTSKAPVQPTLPAN
ncbi:hypothetical protein CAPTEDRAFT_217877 [Capitella teleta]|uniref:BTB domain-containing protein n=1 Tax=Capitella teleta TaxID=283909 RepID=R7VGQ3_CAPTE|nr:hypothetical protein CAPTEDRAFT_217877 [Capitella teleta]|eukprot:ELU17732.1 hypothetical protein CAPTEDRAFT_217877 [Capitella teleta]